MQTLLSATLQLLGSSFPPRGSSKLSVPVRLSEAAPTLWASAVQVVPSATAKWSGSQTIVVVLSLTLTVVVPVLGRWVESPTYFAVTVCEPPFSALKVPTQSPSTPNGRSGVLQVALVLPPSDDSLTVPVGTVAPVATFLTLTLQEAPLPTKITAVPQLIVVVVWVVASAAAEPGAIRHPRATRFARNEDGRGRTARWSQLGTCTSSTPSEVEQRRFPAAPANVSSNCAVVFAVPGAGVQRERPIGQMV